MIFILPQRQQNIKQNYYLLQSKFQNNPNIKKNLSCRIMSYQVGGQQIGTEVILNIYDLDPKSNQFCSVLGLGFYHTGIQLGLNQYTFAGHNGTHTGVMEVTPKTNTPNLRESLLLGSTNKNWREITRILDELRQAFPGNSYHYMRKNCNAFSNALSEALLGKKIPGYVNRMASLGSVFLDIDDFVRMRPYDGKYETKLKKQQPTKKNVFEKRSKGIRIG